VSPAEPAPVSDEEPKPQPSKLGKFIQTYHSFLSTFVIGAAGLIATSIWQYKQSEIARRQAESQQTIAQTQAENSWRIERAEILSKNLQVLASSGGNNVEQRYGVLLSLTRGNILDPELAVSYALELGKDNPDYMKSVLSNTSDKSYARLANAFELTCGQRFGVTRDVALCKADKDADRSSAIAELISDELEAAHAQGKPGPMSLLTDERVVQETPARLAWLFTPFLQQLYERRLWAEIDRFESFSTGGKLVAALVLGPSRPSEFVASSEQAEVEKFHEQRMKWLLAYVFGATCNGECKGKLIDVMVTLASEAHGRFDDALSTLLRRPRTEVASALSRLHTRLLTCQVSQEDLASLRDRVLVPALAEELIAAKPDVARLDDLLGLVALMPPTPDDKNDPAPKKAWDGALKKAKEVMKDHFARSFTVRRAAAQRARQHPLPALKKAMFCTAAESESQELDLGED
jgi:hypothetical protein